MSFPTTNWTMLAHASLNGDTNGRAALEDMCRHYWAPVRAAIGRHWPWPGEDDDLTQDFFVHLMERSMLRRADRERGRFRSYLLGALKFYLAHKLEAARAAKRGAGRETVPIEEWMAPADDGDPAFDRDWAVQILVRAMGRLEQETGPASFSLLRPFLPGADAPASYEKVAGDSGKPLGTLKSEVSRLRKRLREIIRLEVARTVSAPHEIDGEFAYLQRMLRQ